MFVFDKQCASSAKDHSDHQFYGAELKSSSENQPSSTLEPDPEIIPYVEARQLSFQFKSSNPLLTNINLTVPKGKIYALLGASGCGKTSLLRIILGIYKPLSGTIKVNGKQPGTPESQIPGVGVGYMPQNVALIHSLSIEENLVYFGSLYGLSRSTIKENVKQLIEILNLPEKKRMVSQLSGGQQRRVSLAISLIHQPPLLILDEPTVGVDPLLRQKIWLYLEELCLKRDITVMLTTHYTEEAINAYRVGFIYSGTILAEDNPQRLLLRYQCTLLEDVFLGLCLEKDKKISAQPQSNLRTSPESESSAKAAASEPDIPKESEDAEDAKIDSNIGIDQKKTFRFRFSIVRLRAKLANHHYKFNRQIVILLIFVPIFQATLFGTFYVRNLGRIPVAVVNEEQNGSNQSLSKLFIKQIDQKALDLQYHNGLDDAINAIHSNRARMVIRFTSNYSKYFRKRLLHPEKVTEKVANNSKILLYADTSQSVVHFYAYHALLKAFKNYTRSVGDMLGYNPNFFGSPIQTQKPIYGTMSMNYFSFSLGGMLIAIVHPLCFILSTTMVVEARTLGFLERELVAGITIEEYLLATILLYVVPIMIINLEMVFIIFVLFGVPCVGSLWHLFIMIFVDGLQGFCFGLVPSVVARNMVEAILLGATIEMPLIFSCGLISPIDVMPVWLHKILKWNPMALPILTAQYIIYRGWSLMRFEVLQGLLYNIGLIILFLLFSSVYFRIFK